VVAVAYIVSATATLKNNWVFSNTARFGGGLYLSCSDATIRGNTIVANTAEWYPSVWPGFGGGLYLYQSNATLAGNVIMSNTTDYSGGGLYLEGSSAWLNRNTISSNTADEEGGGLSLFNSGAKLTGNVISFNSADGDYAYGGGALVVDSDPTLEANTVISNSASAGGGLALIDSNGTLVNNIVADNLVDAVGSGLVIEFDLESGPLRLLHTTIARNRGGDGSGVYVSCYYSSHCVVAMTNTVLVSQTLGVYATSGSTVTLQATLWGTATWANESDWGGAGNIITGTVGYRYLGQRERLGRRGQHYYRHPKSLGRSSFCRPGCWGLSCNH
jgi:parallel beta-helix repeat protein